MFHHSKLMAVSVSMGAILFAAGPDYDRDNPIVQLTQRARGIRLAGEPPMYVRGSLSYLFPLVSYGVPADDKSLAGDGRGSTQEALRAYRL